MFKSIVLAGLVNVLMSTVVGAKEPLVSAEAATIDIKNFAKEIADEHQFDESIVLAQLLKLKSRQDIIDKITRPAESMPWHRYRQIWMKAERIDAGVAFWNKHADTLAAAQLKYGVDPAIIVGIIGVETLYGRIQGSFPVIEALHTLGFHYPKRASFFRRELAQYFLLAREQNWDISSIKGSYAGAMGMGQFISSSYRAYGTDFNQDGKVNLFDDPVDMIGSVANYFSRHHWSKDGFVVQPVSLSELQKSLVQTDLELNFGLADLQAKQIDISALQDKSNKAGVFAFDLADNTQEYWLAGDNFYVITRYNHNAMYALAVFQLSEAIKAKRATTVATSTEQP